MMDSYFDDAVIIGDSLTSDMLGGARAGIRCWWYNPRGKAARGESAVDREIRNLAQISGLLKGAGA